MNEYELTLFSLYFDNINFNNKNNIENNFNTEKIFIYLGLYIKQITNDYFREIFEYFMIKNYQIQQKILKIGKKIFYKLLKMIIYIINK